MYSPTKTITSCSLILLLTAWFVPQAAFAQNAKPVAARLKLIVFPQVIFDGLPLPEVAKMLSADSKKYDPDKQGIPMQVGTESPVRGALATTIVTLTMKNATLEDVLKAITKGANPAITYQVQGEKVVFRLGGGKAVPGQPKKK